MQFFDTPVKQILKSMKKEDSCQRLNLDSWLFNRYPKFPNVPANVRPRLNIDTFNQLVQEIEKYVVNEFDVMTDFTSFNNFLKCYMKAGGDINKLGTTMLPDEYNLCVRLYNRFGDRNITYTTFCGDKNILQRLLREQARILSELERNPGRNLSPQETKILNITNQAGDTVLVNAIRDENIDLVKALLRNGVNPNIRLVTKIDFEARIFRTERNALDSAIKSNNMEIIKLLLNNGACVFQTALGRAIDYTNDINVVKLLLEHGARITYKDIAISAKNPRHDTIFNYLMGLLNKTQKEKIVEDAVNLHDTKLIKKLLDYGFDINKKDRRGNTLMHMAVEDNNVEFVDILLNRGLSLYDENNNGVTPLDLAIRNLYRIDVINFLLNKKILDPDQRVDEENDFLHYAIVNDNTRFARDLLELGAEPNKKRRTDGKTPLMLAGENYEIYYDSRYPKGHTYMIELLLEYGADPEITDKNGYKMIDYITGEDKKSTIRNLINR